MIKKYEFTIQNGDAAKDDIDLFIEIDEKNEIVEFFKGNGNTRNQEYVGFICLTEFKEFFKGFKEAF